MKATVLVTAGTRIVELRQKYGLWGLAWRALAKLGVCLHSTWRRLARNRNHVFVCDAPADAAGVPDGLNIARYADLEEIPKQVLAELVDSHGLPFMDNLRKELAGQAVLWVGLINGRAAGLLLTRLGCHITRWFVPLRDHDLIIFAVGTVAEYRGRGIAPAMMRHTMASELRGDGRAFIDCKVWNKASIRSIQKAGFRWVATKKPIG